MLLYVTFTLTFIRLIPLDVVVVVGVDCYWLRLIDFRLICYSQPDLLLIYCPRLLICVRLIYPIVLTCRFTCCLLIYYPCWFCWFIALPIVDSSPWLRLFPFWVVVLTFFPFVVARSWLFLWLLLFTLRVLAVYFPRCCYLYWTLERYCWLLLLLGRFVARSLLFIPVDCCYIYVTKLIYLLILPPFLPTVVDCYVLTPVYLVGRCSVVVVTRWEFPFVVGSLPVVIVLRSRWFILGVTLTLLLIVVVVITSPRCRMILLPCPIWRWWSPLLLLTRYYRCVVIDLLGIVILLLLVMVLLLLIAGRCKFGVDWLPYCWNCCYGCWFIWCQFVRLFPHTHYYHCCSDCCCWLLLIYCCCAPRWFLWLFNSPPVAVCVPGGVFVVDHTI